jgi:hypothetical protein
MRSRASRVYRIPEVSGTCERTPLLHLSERRQTAFRAHRGMSLLG